MGITTIYTLIDKETTLIFQSDIKLALLKEEEAFKCDYTDNEFSIKPLRKDATTDLMIVLENQTIYRLILIEGNHEGYYGLVNFVETRI
jgi:hypothetical protein